MPRRSHARGAASRARRPPACRDRRRRNVQSIFWARIQSEKKMSTNVSTSAAIKAYNEGAEASDLISAAKQDMDQVSIFAKFTKKAEETAQAAL
jgi:hypothetical protein